MKTAKTLYKNFHFVDHPLIKKDVTVLRDASTQTELFRAAIHRISNILAVEISRDFLVTTVDVQTPLERTTGYKLIQDVILVPVLRAGLGMVSGFLEVMPDAKVGHIGLQRDEETLLPHGYYFKIPQVDDADVILLDPMLATGGSSSEAIRFLKKKGINKISFACIVAAPEGILKIQNDHPEVNIFGAALDRQLNDRGYILPGLGDAGDRTFGTL